MTKNYTNSLPKVGYSNRKIPSNKSNVVRARRLNKDTSMKQWFRSKIKNFLYPNEAEQSISIAREDHSPDITRNSLRFSVLSARGGTIVQIHQYERRTDETNVVTYVISDGEDIAARVGEIVSMEMLRNH